MVQHNPDADEHFATVVDAIKPWQNDQRKPVKNGDKLTFVLDGASNKRRVRSIDFSDALNNQREVCTNLVAKVASLSPGLDETHVMHELMGALTVDELVQRYKNACESVQEA